MVSSDRTSIVTEGADENRIESSDLDLMLAWYRNALSRLSRLVIANYVTITKMLVQDGVDCAEILPASIQKMNSMYHDVLTKCRSVSDRKSTRLNSSN